MAYLVEYSGSGTEGRLNASELIYWQNGETRWVSDEFIAFYQAHSDVFAVLRGPDIGDVLIEGADAEDYVDSLVLAGLFPGSLSAAYIDFSGTGEAGMKITIDGVDYQEADTAVPATGVWTNGASAANSAASLLAAINGDTRAAVPFTAVADVSGDGVWLFADAAGNKNVTITTTSAANCTVQDASGGAAAAIKKILRIKHTVNTQELLSGAVEIPLPFTPTTVNISAYSSTGAPIYFTNLVTVQTSPVRLRLATNGATALANSNVLHIFAAE